MVLGDERAELVEVTGESVELSGVKFERFEDEDEASEALVDEEASSDDRDGRIGELLPSVELVAVLGECTANRPLWR
ncbi:hypothetical protein PGT21_002167 [Puccinia graminis f. sp. tritici]|uniref:Uncharacterized protein n=1 Tax=Puccinia graminis f. sp. tritici TaxID=56615 RepID=A0A5B0NL74_PUCGR|nr:hypothetical protein PGT21_002167 [Puccinia graminis f. sp. tritici]